MNAGVGSAPVVVKELKTSASVQEQMQFLEEAQPYRWGPGPGSCGEGAGGGCGARALGTKASSVLSLLLPHPCRASPPPRPPAPSCPEFESGGQPVGSRRALQHSNLLQCLAQCAEVTPYLLVMEFCPMVSGRAPLCQRPSVRPSVWGGQEGLTLPQGQIG